MSDFALLEPRIIVYHSFLERREFYVLSPLDALHLGLISATPPTLPIIYSDLPADNL